MSFPPTPPKVTLIQEISPKDTMFIGNEEHYYGVGSSALRCVQLAMFAANRDSFDKILDFPCGHGRVLRFLKAAFPNAQFTAADLDQDAVDFCAETFEATPIYSSNNTQQITIEERFDLIWCGSLLTHFEAARCLEFLGFLKSLLSPNGILIFTMHGRLSADWLRNRQQIYGLEPEKVPEILQAYDSTGFGYLDYPGVQGYGISISSPAWVVSYIEKIDDLKLLSYTETGWDSHQDVIACIRVAK
jgi:SAM-dependent methyltransferase